MRHAAGNQPEQTVVLVSGCGTRNFGDDIIARHWVRYYRPRPVILIAGGTRLEFLGSQPHVIEALTFHEFFAGKLDPSGTPLLIHIVGGGFVNDFFDVAAPMARAIGPLVENGSRVVCTGTSFFPLQLPQLVASIPFSYCSVRDRYSSRLPYRHVAPRLNGDDAYMIPETELRCDQPQFSPRTLLVCVQSQFGCEQKLGAIGATLGRIARNDGFEAVRVVQLCDGDEQIFDHVDFQNKDCIRYEALMKTGLPQSSNSYFISTRFHFRLLCERLGIPGLGVVINRYYDNKHEHQTSLDKFLFVGPAILLDDLLALEHVPKVTPVLRARMFLRKLKLRALAARNLRAVRSHQFSAPLA
jgi:hypothetical protein